MTDPTAESIRKAIRRLTYSVSLLAIVLLAAILLVWLDASSKRSDLRAAQTDLRRDEVNTNAALCALRHDLERRVQSGEDFLLQHPTGIPGIPPAAIRTSLDSQRRSIAALSGLKCPPE